MLAIPARGSEGSETQNHLWQESEFKAILGHTHKSQPELWEGRFTKKKKKKGKKKKCDPTKKNKEKKQIKNKKIKIY